MADILYKYGMKLTPKGNHSLQFRKPKMEIGTVATDWSPAPEDPDADLLERINVLQTDFQVVQGEIQAKVWETDIEKATDGLYESMNEMYAYINETINGISAEVGNLTFTVENNYYTLTEQISDLVITTDSITGMVRDTQQTMETYYDELTGEIISNYNTTMDLIASIQIEADSITSTVANIQTTVDNLINPANILLHTRDMDMAKPYELGSGYVEQEIDVWNVYHSTSSSYPLDASYVFEATSIGWYRTDTENYPYDFREAVWYWKISDDILFDNMDKLTEGETYTFSFYMHRNGAEDTENRFIWVDGCVYGQTVLKCNYEIHDDGPSLNTNSLWGRYILLPDVSKDSNYDYNSSSSWYRIEITFRLDDLANFRLGVSSGREGRSSYGAYFGGFMLNKGESAINWDDGMSAYFATTDYVYSKIEQLGNSIKLEVKSTTNGSASIVMTVNGEDAGGDTIYPSGLRQAFAEDTSAITISAGTITFNSNTFIVNSTYFSVTADGTITATAGLIGGLTLSDNSMYRSLSDIDDMSTSGMIIYAGLNPGVRVNYNNVGALLRYGRLQFQHATWQDTTGYISGNAVYTNTGGYGLRIAGAGIISVCTPWLLASGSYAAPGESNSGSVGLTGSIMYVSEIVRNSSDNTVTSFTYSYCKFVNGICIG